MDDSTPVEPRTKEPFEMDDQSFVSSDTYQADFDTASQFDSPGRSTSGRWHTTNSSNTMELERHLSASSVSRDVRSSSVSNQRHEDGDRPDVTNLMPRLSEGQFAENDPTIMASDPVNNSHEQMESAAFKPGHLPSQVFGDNSSSNNSEGRYDSSENFQSRHMMPTPLLDPGLMDHRGSRSSNIPCGISEQQEPANLFLSASIKQEYDNLRTGSSSDQRRGSRGRLDPADLNSTSGHENRGRSPSPRPKVSAETKARWAMLKQLAGVSQPHDVEEEDRHRRLDEEMRTTEAGLRVREEASVRDSSQTGDHADDASIERYLQKLQGDPHIDSRGLREGLSRMHSYEGSNGQQDQYSAHNNRFQGDTHLGARRLSDDTRIRGIGNEMCRGEQDARNMLHGGEGGAEQAFSGREAGLRRDQHALGAGLKRTGRRAEEKLRSTSRDTRGHLQTDKQAFERAVRGDTNVADAELHKLEGQTARDFRKGERGLEAGLQEATRGAESLLIPMNVRQNLRRGEHSLMGDVQNAENAFSRTGLGQEIRRGEHDLVGEVHKLEHEFPHIGLGQEIRKGEANLMGNIHKVENEMANTGLGQEVREGEHHLVDELHKLEHELPHLGLGQDLRRGKNDLKQGLHEAADHLRRDEQFLAGGAEAVGRSVEHGAEHVGRFAVEGAAIAGGVGMIAVDHARSGNTAPNLRPNVPQSGHGMINPNGQLQSGGGGPHPPRAPGSHPASNFQGLNQPPANHQIRPSIVEPPHQSPTPQTPQPGHNRGPSGSQQPHLSPAPSPARASSPGPGMNRVPLGRMPCPSPGDNRRSQTPIRKPVLPPRPQGSPHERPPTAMPPHPQTQRPQGATQHPLQPQHPQGGPQHPPQSQHPQGAPQHPPQIQHSQAAQPHPPNTMPQHPQPSHPQGAPQHPQTANSQHSQLPHPQGIPQPRQPPSTVPQHSPSQHPMSAPQHSPNAITQHPQSPYPQGGRQQSQPPNVMPQHPQTPHPHGVSQQRQPANAMPQHPPPPHPQGPPKQRSQSPMPPHTLTPHPQRNPQQIPQGPRAPHPQGAPQERPIDTGPHHQPQLSPGARQPRLPNDRREGEAQRPQAVSNTNVQQVRQAMPDPSVGPGAHPARAQPLFNERPKSEGKADEEEPRASIMQERRRKAADSQRRLAERQGQQKENVCRHEDHNAESCPLQTERLSTTEPHSISGPQSMLNIFKARADAAIDASGDCPSFTDRLLIEMIQLLCNMAQDAMPEIERRLAQNQREDCS